MVLAGWHTYDHYAWANSLQGVAPPFINILGVLFGLTLAILANDTWSARDQATRAVYREADALLGLIASEAFAQNTTDNVQALMLNKISEARDERDQRVALSQTHVNPLKWLGMGFLGLLTLLSIAIVHIDKPRAALVANLIQP